MPRGLAVFTLSMGQKLTEWLGNGARGTTLRTTDVSSVRPMISIVRQVTAFDCGGEPPVRRFRRLLEPATVGQCLVTGGFGPPEDGMMLARLDD